MIMPQVILQIEDLSVEKVQAQLPPQEDLLPPERKIPVLSEGELAIGEPTIPAAAVESEALAGQPRDRLLAADVDVGAGNDNRIVANISLKTLGVDPRFSLLFNHETLDGFSGKPAGSGFSLRNDDLEGNLNFRLGSVDTALKGNFLENETGLQSQPVPAYSARLGRTLGSSAEFSSTPLDWLTLRGTIEGGRTPSSCRVRIHTSWTGCAWPRSWRQRATSVPSKSACRPVTRTVPIRRTLGDS